MYQDNDNDPVAEDSVVTAAAVAPHDDDGDDDDDDADDGDGESRQKRRKQSREEPAHAPTADDDEDDAISSPGHPPVRRLSARAPPRRCSRSHPLQPEIGHRDWSIISIRELHRTSVSVIFAFICSMCRNCRDFS